MEISKELPVRSTDDNSENGALKNLQPIMTFPVVAKLLAFIVLVGLLVCKTTTELGSRACY